MCHGLIGRDFSVFAVSGTTRHLARGDVLDLTQCGTIWPVRMMLSIFT